MMIYNHGIRILIEENLQALENRPEDRELDNALRKALRRSRWVMCLFDILEYLRSFNGFTTH